MKLYGNGRVALVDDPGTAGRLGWLPRRRSAAEPEARLAQRGPGRPSWPVRAFARHQECG